MIICVTNDIDTLATALYVRIDDLLKQCPDLAPWRPKIGLQPQLTDAELVTLAVMQALLGYTSEARWIRHAHAHPGHLFGICLGSPGTTGACAPLPERPWRGRALAFRASSRQRRPVRSDTPNRSDSSSAACPGRPEAQSWPDRTTAISRAVTVAGLCAWAGAVNGQPVHDPR
jgi:hypothetical protein